MTLASGAQTSAIGVAAAIDGDSLNVGETEVRLFGIDAPEFNQTCSRNLKAWRCGEEAADQLSQLVTGKQVRCTSIGKDQHGRTLGRCSVGSVDVNRQMVALGYAVAFRHYSLDYVGAEQSAKAAKRGLWSGSFTMPSDYRNAKDGIIETPVLVGKVQRGPDIVSGTPACTIKGNRGSNGWIYHVPGMPYYERTRAEEMFCTETQARAAGYRRAKVR